MKNLFVFIFLLTALSMSSCVSRVTISDEEKPMLVIDLQMLRGSDNIFATVHTSNNLNGTFPIEKPEDVIITVKDVTSDNFSDFVYNPETEVYEYISNEDLLIPNKQLRLEAEIKGTEIPKIRAFSKVPQANNLVDTELISTSIYNDGDSGLEYWQGKIKFNFINLNTTESLFYQVELNEKLQTRSIENGEVVYTTITTDQTPFTIVDVISGQFAVKDFVNRKGLWIDLDKMNTDFFEIELRSNYPIEMEGQTSDNLFTKVVSISEAHYDYFLGLNNIETSSRSLFGEQGLYRSNIEKGLGVFSTSVSTNEVINLAQ